MALKWGVKDDRPTSEGVDERRPGDEEKSLKKGEPLGFRRRSSIQVGHRTAQESSVWPYLARLSGVPFLPKNAEASASAKSGFR